MAVLLLICLLPLMSMAVAEFIAQVYGCKLDLAAAHPCIVGGRDIGHDLLTLGMMGYFLFVTMPAVVAVIAVWVVVELIGWLRRRSTATG
jgi:hypothetical protein